MSTVDATEAHIKRLAPVFDAARAQIARVLVGQQAMVDALLIGLLADGHVLLEGAPGLAKTTAVKAVAQALELDFSRIQFTPDLLPADLVGTQIYEPKSGTFRTRQGPVVANILLADEINRAPAKVQSALLEAMQERQVTLGDKTFPLPKPFLVLATQNPIEQEGTYPLPEAQTDRFLLKIAVDYPTKEEELAIVRLSSEPAQRPDAVATAQDILEAQRVVRGLYISDIVMEYIVDLVRATRHPGELDTQLGHAVDYGASPRASIALAGAARARAFLDGDGHCAPRHVRAVAPDVLRHRILPSYEAEADGVGPDQIIARLLDLVNVS